MKKYMLFAFSLLSASLTFAQSVTTTITTYSNPQTINVGGCSFIGVTSVTTTAGQDTLTAANGTLSGSCGSGNNGGPPPHTVTVAPSSISFSIPAQGTTAPAAPTTTISFPNDGSAAGSTCTLTNSITGAAQTVAGTQTLTLDTPTTAGTTNYGITCTVATDGGTVTASPPTVTVNATQGCTGASCIVQCAASQISPTIGFSRQCSTVATYPTGSMSQQTIPATSLLDTALYGTFPGYTRASGNTLVLQINSGSYVALQFTPSQNGQLQLTSNPSYGDGGIISLSTVPGSFLTGDPGLICAYTRSASNSINILTSGGACAVSQGQTYYLNFADASSAGAKLCYGSAASTCSTSKVAYSVLAGASK